MFLPVSLEFCPIAKNNPSVPKFVKELNKETGLMTTTNEPFLPNINNLIYTVTVDSKNFVHFFIGSTEVAGGLQDALMKLIVAGHAHLVSKSN